MTPNWRVHIEAQAEYRPEPIPARTFLRTYHTSSRPVQLLCSDGFEYVVKGRNSGRAIVNEQIVGRLGPLIDAPVASVELISVPEELVEVSWEMAHIPPGICHGSRYIHNTSGRSWLEYLRESANRNRIAALAVLYGWMHAGDHQLIYENAPPHFVHSVDHGHFMPEPEGPEWRLEDLIAYPEPRPDRHLMEDGMLSMASLRPTAEKLQMVTDERIAFAVAVSPDDWGITMDERMVLAEYLALRRSQLVNSIL